MAFPLREHTRLPEDVIHDLVLMKLHAVGLRGAHGLMPAQLSGGMSQRVAIARALVNRPDLIVLDEPTTGLDPAARRGVWDVLAGLRAQGVTFLLTTHYMEEAARLCDRLVIMDRGKVVDEGAPAELTARHGQPDLEGVFLHLTGHGLG